MWLMNAASSGAVPRCCDTVGKTVVGLCGKSPDKSRCEQGIKPNHSRGLLFPLIRILHLVVRCPEILEISAAAG